MSWTTETLGDRYAWGYCVEQGPARGSVRGRGQGGGQRGGLRGGRVSQQVHVGDDYYQAVPRFGDVTDGMRNLSFAASASPRNQEPSRLPVKSPEILTLKAQLYDMRNDLESEKTAHENTKRQLASAEVTEAVLQQRITTLGKKMSADSKSYAQLKRFHETSLQKAEDVETRLRDALTAQKSQHQRAYRALVEKFNNIQAAHASRETEIESLKDEIATGQPLLDVGIAIRGRFFEQMKLKTWGPGNEDKGAINWGNENAHWALIAADTALFDLNVLGSDEDYSIFETIYDRPVYNDCNEHKSVKLADVINMFATSNMISADDRQFNWTAWNTLQDRFNRCQYWEHEDDEASNVVLGQMRAFLVQAMGKARFLRWQRSFRRVEVVFT